MTSIAQYRRTVKDYLREGYGVDPLLVAGAKHSKFVFDFDGRRRTILLNDRNGAGGSNAAEMKMQDVRREIGEPTWPGRVEPERRSLDDMVPPLLAQPREVEAPSPSGSDLPTYLGSVSLRVSNSSLYSRAKLRNHASGRPLK